MIVAVYRWRLKPGSQDAFTAVWSEATLVLRERGSGGSALFNGPDGIVWGLARWPDAATRDAAFAQPLHGEYRSRMDACIEERFDALELDAVADLWTAFTESEPPQ
ncbi:hypothetical protein D3C80_1356450 [compost metagenome]